MLSKYITVWIILISWINVTIDATKCEYCQKDFVSLGRHTWCCPAKATSTINSHGAENQQVPLERTIDINIPTDEIRLPASKVDVVLCVCGRACKGPKGLSMYRRTCKVANTLNVADTEGGGAGEVHEDEYTNIGV